MKKHLKIMIIFVIFSSILLIYSPLLLSIGSKDSRFYLSYFSDDFFYYLQIAKNICLLGQSTFDTLTLTNGYHPLWMLILTALTCITRDNEFLLIFTVLSIKAVLSTLSFYLFYKIAFYFLNEKYQSYVVVIIPFFIFLRLTFGMEVLLTVPLFAYFILLTLENHNNLMHDKWLFLKLGFIASLLVLSRLDTAIFILLFFLYITSLFWHQKYKLFTSIVFFAIGGLLVPIYLLSNILFFDTLLPLSGMAKQLKVFFSFTPSAITNILSFTFQKIETLAFVLTLVAPLFFVFSQVRKDKRIHLLILIAIYPLVYYFVLAFVSDWPIWHWYLYPLPTALLAISIIIIKVFAVKETISKVLTFILILFVSLEALKPYLDPKVPAGGIYKTALAITKFAKEHPGIYSMGDRAGKAGYLIGNPLVQLEGLVADKQMIQFIKNETDLIKVLKFYKVNYYIASKPVKKDGCYSFIEPVQAGVTSHKMRGKLCYDPIVVYKELGTYIFKIN